MVTTVPLPPNVVFRLGEGRDGGIGMECQRNPLPALPHFKERNGGGKETVS